MNSKENLFLLVDFYRKHKNTSKIEGKGTLIFTLPHPLKEYEDFLSQISNIALSTDETSQQITFSVPVTSSTAPFFFTFEQFLTTKKNLYAPPDCFFIGDLDYLHGNNEKIPDEIKRYFCIIHLIDALSTLSDYSHLDSMARNCLIFLSNRIIKLPISYDKDSIRDLPCLQNFINNYINDGIHKDQKHSIIKSTLSTFLRSIPEGECFEKLLNDFNIFFEEIQSSYEVYVSEFSFEKIKNEAEKKRLEYTLQLNKTLSSVQSQLITIPLSLLVVGTQVVSGKTDDLKNWILLISMVMFSILMWIVTINQRSSISATLTEIKLSKQQLENYKGMKERIGKIYEELEKTGKRHIRCINTIRIIIFLILILTIFLIFKPTALEHAISCLLDFISFLSISFLNFS